MAWTDRIPVGLTLMLIAGLLACGQSNSGDSGPPVVTVVEAADEPLTMAVFTLDDEGDDLLARPWGFASFQDGGFAMGDRSDLNVKAYDAAGRRLRTYGGPGDGPGEFRVISSISTLHDSLVAYDVTRGAVTVFTPVGEAGRIFREDPAPFQARIVEDSILLGIFRPGQGRPLLAVQPLRDPVVDRFLEPVWLDEHPHLRLHTATYADAEGGFIHAALFGSDHVYTFDYQGRPLTTRRLPGIDSIVERWNRAGQVLQQADGRWFHDGLVAIMGVLALPGGCAAITVAPYDTEVGTDLFTGSRLIVLPPPGQDRPATAYWLEGHAVGMTKDGKLAVLAYEDDVRGTMTLSHLETRCDSTE